MYYKLNDSGEPVQCEDLLDWATWFEANGQTRVIACDHVGKIETSSTRRVPTGSIGTVSTVFLGVDTGLMSLPRLFETMIFGGKHAGWEQKSSSREEAMHVHKRAVAMLHMRMVYNAADDNKRSTG